MVSLPRKVLGVFYSFSILDFLACSFAYFNHPTTESSLILNRLDGIQLGWDWKGWQDGCVTEFRFIFSSFLHVGCVRFDMEGFSSLRFYFLALLATVHRDGVLPISNQKFYPIVCHEFFLT